MPTPKRADDRSVPVLVSPRCQAAMRLHGFIASQNGDYDWIVMDSSVDFAALFGRS